VGSESESSHSSRINNPWLVKKERLEESHGECVSSLINEMKLRRSMVSQQLTVDMDV